MSSEEIRRLEKKLDQRADDIMAGMSKLGERVSSLELDKARREGRESVLGTTESLDWRKLAMSLAKSLGYGLGAAYLIAKAFLG